MAVKKHIDDKDLYPICHEVIRQMFKEQERDHFVADFISRTSIPVLIRFCNKSLKFDFSSKRAYAFSTEELSSLAELKKDLLFLELSDMFIKDNHAEIMASLSIMPTPNPRDSKRLRCYKVRLSRTDKGWQVV